MAARYCCSHPTTSARCPLPIRLLRACVACATPQVRQVGFFAPGGEGLYVLTGSETLGLWHKATAQCLNPASTDARALLGGAANYLAGCHFDAATGKLLLAAGDWGGGLLLCEVSDSGVAPVAALGSGGSRGHGAVVRSCLWGGAGGLVTGGEDARVCAWSLNPANQPPPPVAPKKKAPSAGGKGRPGPSGGGGGGGGREAAERGGARPY